MKNLPIGIQTFHDIRDKKENYKTLKDLYEIKKEDLIKIRGIGTVRAENIIEVIKNEIRKYK